MYWVCLFLLSNESFTDFNTVCSLQVITSWSLNPELLLNLHDSGVLQCIITGTIIPSWAYTNFSPSINSDPCLLYFLICLSLRLLLKIISLWTMSWLFLTSNNFCISIIVIYNTDLLSALFTFIVWTLFLANVSTVTLNILYIIKK